MSAPRDIAWALLLLAWAPFPATSGAASSADFTVGFRFPQRETDDAPRWAHPAASIDMNFGPKTWPVSVNAYVSGSRDEYRRRVDSTDSPGFFYAQVWYVTVESGLGARMPWSAARFMPFVSGGHLYLTQMTGRTYGPEDFEYRHALGGWTGVGVLARLGTEFHVGASGRHSVARLEGGAAGGGT